jgi:hypothetical protein
VPYIVAHQDFALDMLSEAAFGDLTEGMTFASASTLSASFHASNFDTTGLTFGLGSMFASRLIPDGSNPWPRPTFAPLTHVGLIDSEGNVIWAMFQEIYPGTVTDWSTFISALTIDALLPFDARHITGSNEDDVLAGSKYCDWAWGSEGDDKIYGRGDGDQLFGEGGADELYGDAGDDTLVGGEGRDLLEGGDGDDILIGGAGANILRGGADDDLYLLGSDMPGLNQIFDVEGNDTVVSSISRSLVSLATIENVVLSGNAGVNAIGNGLANTLTGNNAANVMRGWQGRDTLLGCAGDDRLYGDQGADVLVGGRGGDILNGGLGPDVFRFDARFDSTRANPDRIIGFTPGADAIDLSALFDREIDYIDTSEFTGRGQVRIEDVPGAFVAVEVNLEGSLAADLVIMVRMSGLRPITVDDFIL